MNYTPIIQYYKKGRMIETTLNPQKSLFYAVKTREQYIKNNGIRFTIPDNDKEK